MNIDVGVAYYPEFHDESLWESDLREMRLAGISCVRILEFAWGKLQPNHETYAFDWLRRFLGLAGVNEIDVILCTPTCCPPDWMLRKYPEINLTGPDGKPSQAARKMASPSSRRYRDLCEKLLIKLVETVQGFPNITSWQIDNELGPHESGPCFGAETILAYRRWLEKRYGTLEKINRAWKTSQFSHEINSWENIPVPRNNGDPAPQLAFRRFTQSTIEDFYRFQVGVLRKAGIKVPIWTNLMMPIYEGMSYWEFAPLVDVIAVDCYFHNLSPEASSLGLDVMRNLTKKPFWISETGTLGGRRSSALQSELRLWAWRAIARGARRLIYFRWRTCASGLEYEHPAFLTPSHQATTGLEELRSWQAEAKKILPELSEFELPKAKVAIVLDWQTILSAWKVGEWWPDEIVKAEQHLLDCYRWFFRRGIQVDIVRPGFDPSEYNLVVVPGLANRMSPPSGHEPLIKWVRKGGVIVATALAYSKDDEGNYDESPNPVGLTEVFGLTVGRRVDIRPVEYQAWSVHNAGIGVHWGENRGDSLAAQMWIESLNLHGAKVEAVYQGRFDTGTAAITSHVFGRGSAWYAATVVDSANLDVLLSAVYSRAGWKSPDLLPTNIERVQCGPYEIFMNHDFGPAEIPIKQPVKSIVLGCVGHDLIRLDSYGVAIVERFFGKTESPDSRSNKP